MFVLIEDAEVYDPEPLGKRSILIVDEKIQKVGSVDRAALERVGVEVEVVNADGCLALPGFIDPHEHLLGGSGEGSLALQTPMLFPREILRAGITSVVGTLGVDTTMKTIAGLLARVKTLREEGLSAWMWSGGYNVPPTTVMGTIREDMLFVDEVIGAGEVAISDERSLNQSSQELAKLVRDTHVGGLLSGKAGLTHFHVGEEEKRLQPLQELIEEFHVKPEWLYPTHVQRNERLLREAIDLANAGAAVDFDVVNEDLAKWFRFYLENGGPLERLTVSSDADSSTPDIFAEQIRGLATTHGFSLDLVLPLVTTNPANVLKLKGKGRIAAGCDADLLIVAPDTLELRDVITRGQFGMRNGSVVHREKFLGKSKRAVEILGDQAPASAVASMLAR
ncbi:MAG: amidohydrolase family protein [Gemmatimonadaceae bacterium]